MPYIVTNGKKVVTGLRQDSPYQTTPVTGEGLALRFGDRHQAERYARDLMIFAPYPPYWRAEFVKEESACS